MKTYLKVFVALVVIVATLVWAVNSASTRSYSGTNLVLKIGGGAVTVTNSDQAPVTVQLVSPSGQSFSVASTIAGAAGTSALQGTGGQARQLFELALPSGVSQFTVTRGTNVSLSTPVTTKLDIGVQPLNETDTQTTIIVTIIVILGALYYISRTTGHRWIARLRGQTAPAETVKPSAALFVDTPLRAYGDNRTDISVR